MCHRGELVGIDESAAQGLDAVLTTRQSNSCRTYETPAPESRGFFVLWLADFGKEGRPEPVIAKVNQETLAEMIGTTRSRVSHFMNKFRKLGFIEYNGHLEVHTSLLNMVLREKPEIRRGAESKD